MLGEGLFRRSPSDQVPLLIVRLGEREVGVPVRALQRELAIAEDSPDGQMLDMIAEALAYVPGLRLGDPLPAEVLTGDASWQPGEQHRARAMLRLRMQMMRWLADETGDASLADAALHADQIERDPRVRAALQSAFAHAATAIGLPSGEEVIELVAQVAGEMAFIEALRESLLGAVRAIASCLEGLTIAGWRGDMTRLDSLKQVQRLSRLAVEQIGSRFAEIDAQTGEVISTLRNVEAQRLFIRHNRDWLHRSRLAWQPIADEWRTPPRLLDEVAWSLIAKLYQFLAPRFMPVQEWELMEQLRSRARPGRYGPVLRW